MFGKKQNAFFFCCIFLFGPFLCLTACVGDWWWPGKYTPAKLVNVEKPNPYDDFIKIEKLFDSFGGNLYTHDDLTVKWKDTQLFRMYEFKYHTVVIFPYNWTRKKFDLMLFAGHVKNYNNVYESIFYKYKPNHETRIYYYNETMDLDPDQLYVNEVGIGGFYFGYDRKNIIEKQSRLIEEKWSHDDQQKKIYLSPVNTYPNESSGETDNFNFQLFFLRNKIAYINIYISGISTLGSYKIYEPKITVLTEGEFAITQEDLGASYSAPVKQ